MYQQFIVRSMQPGIESTAFVIESTKSFSGLDLGSGELIYVSKDPPPVVDALNNAKVAITGDISQLIIAAQKVLDVFDGYSDLGMIGAINMLRSALQQ